MIGAAVRLRTDYEVRVRNICATADLGHPVNLDAAAIALTPDLAEYEPEVFPGLIYRPRGMRAAVIVFRSGRLVLTGATAETEVIKILAEAKLRLDLV